MNEMMLLRQRLEAIVERGDRWQQIGVAAIVNGDRADAIACIAIIDEAAQNAERVRVELVCAMRSPDARSREPDLAAAHRAICGVLRALGMPS